MLGSLENAWALPAAGGQKPSDAGTSLANLPSVSQTGTSQEFVSFGVWVNALTELLDTVRAPAMDDEYRKFIALHRLPADDSRLERDFRRVRLLFESTRDGGFWHLRWNITDKQPSSRLIWQQWTRESVRRAFSSPSATAECDELSALVGMLARHLEIYSVGLYYPTWNHTIAVWAPLAGKGKTRLVQLPTTQIFQACDADFDHTTFATRLTNIERYPNADLGKHTRLPRGRADWLLEQIRLHATASPTLWSLIRAKRAYLMGSSMGSCSDTRQSWSRQVADRLSEGDVNSLSALATQELGYELPDVRRVLAWLSSDATAVPGDLGSRAQR